MKPIFFSIIIPVYNVEEYLERCLNSIINQKVKVPFEIICINDASTDNSLKILLEYELKYDNIRVFSNSNNCKLSITRLKAFEHAIGKYIINIDSDDWIEPGALDGIHRAILKSDTDILVFNYKRQNCNGDTFYNRAIEKNKFTSDKSEVISHFLGACWNKVVLRDLLKDLIYGQVPLNSQEDLIFSFEILQKTKSIMLIDDTYYNYFDNSNSITRVISPVDYLKTQSVVLSELKKISNKYKPKDFLIKSVYKYVEKFIFLSIAQIHLSKDNLNNIEYCKQFISDLSQQKLLPDRTLINMKNVIKSKFFSLFMVYRYYNFRKLISIILFSK